MNNGGINNSQLPKGDGLRLPKSWEIKKLGEICEVKNGGTPKTNVKEYWDGDINWITPKDMGRLSNRYVNETPRKITELGLQKSSAKLLPVNSIILSTRAPIGHLTINTTEMATNQGCRGIIPSKKVFTEYLYYFLNNSVEELNDLGTGATFKELSTRALSNFQIPIPPLPEQKRIVSLLDRAFAAIDRAKAHAEQNLNNAKELFESYLNHIFEEKGGDWEEKTFDEMVKYRQIGLIRSTKEQGNDKQYRYLKMDAISNDNYLLHNKYVFVDASLDEIEKYKLDIGDFLFNTRNSYELVGKTCVFEPIDDITTLFNNNIMRVKFLKTISAKFINYAFSSNMVKERIEKLKSGTTSVVGIYYKGLKSMKIPAPLFETQNQIVQKLDQLQAETKKLEAVYQKKVVNLEELKKSILQKAFNGELTEKEISL